MRILLLGIATLLLVGSAAITGLRSNGSIEPALTASAVVNAPIIRISSPFDGQVVHAPPARGAAVRPGDTLVRVKANQADPARPGDVKEHLASAERQHAAINGHVQSLTAAREKLKSRMEHYRTAAIARLSAQLREAEALHNIFKARLSQSNEAFERQQQLKKKGYASQANYDSAAASATVARNDVAASAARIERIRVELGAARDGVFVGDGRDDVPYSQQRDDEIMLRLVDLNARKASLETTIRDLQKQVAADDKRRAAGTVFDQTANVTGVIWGKSSAVGTPVRAGDPLVNMLDCSRAYVEVALDKRDLASIKTGDSARVRLSGTTAVLNGTVRGLRKADARRTPDSQLTVLVDLPKTADTASMQAFCQVGRSAVVTFKRSNPHNGGIIPARAHNMQAPKPLAAKF